MKKKTINRALSMIVVLTLLLGIFPVNTWAVDHVHDESCGYSEPAPCQHAQGQHDDTCGYVAPSEGSTCNHSCGDGLCNYSAGTNGNPCGHAQGCPDMEPGTVCDHTDGCGYSEGTPEVPCDHAQFCTSGGGCGYIAPSDGRLCTHETHNDACGYSEGSACNYAVAPIDDTEHTCSYDDSYQSNENGHWQVCISEGCDLSSSVAQHVNENNDNACDTCSYVLYTEGGTTYTVTYTDGVEDAVIFADVTHTVAEGAVVPIYVPPEREGFIFDGWNPNYTATVTADTIFTAKWREHISDGYTVTYTDGVDSEEIFPDMVYEDLSSGDATPAFEGTPTREDFTFAGWNPEVAATVTGDATYTAQWTENAPAHTHNYTAVVTAPTCSDRGYTTYTCSCNDSYVNNYVDALGHAWGDYISDGDGYHTRTCTTDSRHYQTEKCGGGTATCTDPATCSGCGANYGSLNSTNHTGGTEIRNAKDATETEDGYTGDTYCLGCNTKIETGNTIPATGGGGDNDDTHTHNYSLYKYDSTNHWSVCLCGQGQAGSVKAHNLVLYGNNNGHWKECTACNYFSDLQAHVYSNDSDEICNDCGYNRHVHSYSTATCVAPATCSCRLITGRKNPNNHTGGTEIRNAAEATIVAEGYTGDTYCLGCGSMIASGEVIPKAGVIFDGPGVEDVTFIPAAGTELPGDAEIIVNPHTPSADNLDFLLGINADTEYLDLDDERISMYEIEWFSITYEGVTYKMGEYIIIDGLVYFISSVDSSNHSLHLIRTDNKSDYILELGSNNLINNRDERRFDLPTNKKVSINDITYDVKCIFNTSGVNDEGREQWMLYYGGEPVGTYFPSQSRAVFYEGYDPETLKAQQNVNDLGTVTPGENPIDGLVSGKTYNVSVIGSNDISVPGKENVNGTITQTFAVPDALVGNENVVYAAVHKTASGNEIGTVTISEDGKTLTATYTVSSFSPFTVYAFIEADEPEIKTLSATIVDGSDDATEPVVSADPVPKEGGYTWLWIVVAILAAGAAVAIVIYTKKKKK